MVLKPLEFSDALSDSPWFRQNLHEHEQALDETAKSIKQIADHCRKLISSMRKVCQSQKSFASLLTEFKLATVGSTQTDDERAMANSVKEFGLMLLRIEEHRARILAEAETHYLDPLKELVENINIVLHDSKRKYEKESQRFYSSLEKHLHLSTAKKTDFREADTQLGQQQQAFCQASLQYVSEVQSIQETLKFAFVETLTTFLTHWMTFYKIGNDANEKFRPQLMSIQQKVQNAKQSFEATQAEANMLKQKMLTSHMKTAVFPSGSSSDSSSNLSTGNIKQGYIYMQEKSKIPTKLSRDVLSRPWTKYYCVFSKETRIFTMIPVNSSAKIDMKGALEQSVSFKLKSCIRRASDSIDKRFCFDLVAEERPDVMTFQALSEEDRRQWIDTMDGKEPVYSPGAGPPSANSFDTSWSDATAILAAGNPGQGQNSATYNIARGLLTIYNGSAFLPAFVIDDFCAMLDDTGFEFVRICLKAIEEKGLKEQGLYRNCGVTSKVQRLMQLALDKKKGALERLNLNDDSEWETKTISSAVKTFLRNLPEPLMTFELHNLFINAAKLDDGQQRVNHIHYYVYKLPESHRKMLEIIIRHLRVVADNCGDNLMTVGNLGVCFGPTLLRPQEETMAAIMDIKFCNVVVEVLISNCATIFSSPSSMNIGLPCPPKPAHNILVTNGSETADQSKISPKPAMKNNERNIDDALNTMTATARMVQTVMPNTPSSPSLESSFPQSLVRQRQPPPPPKGAQLYEKVPYESKSSDDLTATSGGSSSSIYPNLSVNQSSRYTTPRVLDGVISTSRGGSGSDDMINPATNPVTATIPRSKFSATYAPPYNPQACDNITYRLQKRHSGGNLMSTSVHANLSSHAQSSSGLSSNGGTTRTAPNPPTFSTMQPLHTSRIPPQYSLLINPEVQYQPSRRVKTLYSCVAGHETELSFEPGQIITNVYESKEEGWLVGTLNGKTGLIPANYVEPLPGPQ